MCPCKGFWTMVMRVLVSNRSYPLWTAAVNGGGMPLHYICDEKLNGIQTTDDIKSKISSNTKAIVLINQMSNGCPLSQRTLVRYHRDCSRQNDDYFGWNLIWLRMGISTSSKFGSKTFLCRERLTNLTTGYRWIPWVGWLTDRPLNTM